jgi:hypothetical protein
MIGAFGFADEPEPGVLAIKPDDVRAVHITRLAPDGSDKAGTTEDKITLAPHKGFPIVLAAPNDLLALAITEGIEDALSFAIATGTGVWAAGSAGHLPDLATVIPNYIEVVHVVIDDDESGRTNGTELVRQIKARGIEVYPIYLKKRRVAA